PALFTFSPYRSLRLPLLLSCPPRRSSDLTWPCPTTSHLLAVISRRPIGPRACSFWVEMPISAPKPNSPPSEKRVEALAMTTAERSEEHTSELQSRFDLVCRLLLEKKYTLS